MALDPRKIKKPEVVYWQSKLRTNASGNAACTFYTPDLPEKYRVVAQGLSDDGIPGFAETTNEVKK